MNKYKLYMLLSISILIISISGSFAWYNWSSTNNALVNLEVCTPTITFAGGSTINGTDIIPVLTKYDGIIKDIEVKANTSCTKEVTMNLYLELTALPTELADSTFVYELYKDDEKLVSGNLANKNQGDTITLISNKTLTTSKDTYTLYIYIDGTKDNDANMAGKNFIFKVWGSGNGAIYKENVIENISSAGSSTSTFFNTEVMREEIETITIAENNVVPEGVTSKDISSSKDGSVMLWYTENENNKYDMYIGGKNGVVQLNTRASEMFAYLTNVEKLNLSRLDTSNVTDMSKMFYKNSELKEINLSNFNTSKVTKMIGMFEDCIALESLDLSSFDTSNVTGMGSGSGYDANRGMFQNCSSLKKIIFGAKFTTLNVLNMSNMFYNCSELTNLDLSSFNTNKVENMSTMFAGCSSLTSLDLSNFDTKKVKDMLGMFQNCSSLKSIDLSSFNTSSVTNMVRMFNGCSSLTSIDLSSLNTSNVTNMNSMFSGCGSLTSLDLSSFNTSKVTNMVYMFNDCSSLTSLDLSNFNTSGTNNMQGLFNGCNSLTNINLSSFDTSNVTSMNSMFRHCSSLTIIDLSTFDTSKVTMASQMFNGCGNLETIYASDLWDTTNVTSSESMFLACDNLKGTNINGNITSYEISKRDVSMANYTNGYLTYKENTE